MNFGNVKRRKASRDVPSSDSLPLRYTHTFKVLSPERKNNFRFSKKKIFERSSTCTKIVSSCLSPSSTSIQSPDPPRKSTYQSRSNDLHRESFLISKSRDNTVHPSPLSISKNNCETTGARHDLSSSSLSREKERKKKNPNVGDCTHARSSGETKALVAWLQGNPIDICTVRVTRAVDGGGNKNAAAREKGGTMETQ